MDMYTAQDSSGAVPLCCSGAGAARCPLLCWAAATEADIVKGSAGGAFGPSPRATWELPKAVPEWLVPHCDAHELEGGRVVSVTALGREMVAFRGADGRAGVLHAFFAHIWARTLGTEGEWKATT